MGQDKAVDAKVAKAHKAPSLMKGKACRAECLGYGFGEFVQLKVGVAQPNGRVLLVVEH